MCFPPKWEKVGKKVGKWERVRNKDQTLENIRKVKDKKKSGYYKVAIIKWLFKLSHILVYLLRFHLRIHHLNIFLQISHNL
jgi:hypothetical protein